jgi:hypothetical protein
MYTVLTIIDVKIEYFRKDNIPLFFIPTDMSHGADKYGVIFIIRK